mmetsp:Transcript_11305/g.30552  ORF Transcript_11305/g.30552 Transcript_11305/m.30552 type:complete len:263 (+) Transcript_11305:2695-3483(+)
MWRELRLNVEHGHEVLDASAKRVEEGLHILGALGCGFIAADVALLLEELEQLQRGAHRTRAHGLQPRIHTRIEQSPNEARIADEHAPAELGDEVGEEVCGEAVQLGGGRGARLGEHARGEVHGVEPRLDLILALRLPSHAALRIPAAVAEQHGRRGRRRVERVQGRHERLYQVTDGLHVQVVHERGDVGLAPALEVRVQCREQLVCPALEEGRHHLGVIARKHGVEGRGGLRVAKEAAEVVRALRGEDGLGDLIHVAAEHLG